MRTIGVNGLDERCSQIVLGTSFFRPSNKENVFNIIDKYVELGGNVLDTSRVYGVGESMRAVAMWMKERKPKKVMIISKCCHHYCDEQGQHPEQKRVGRKYIDEDLHHSLDMFGLDHIDMFLMHRDDPQVPVDELIDTLEEHRVAGLIKSYGVSNWSTARMNEALAYADKKGHQGIALNSPSLSLAKIVENRWEGTVYADNDYIAWHERTNLPLFSWAAQASGFFYFASKYKKAEFPNPDIARVYYSDENMERLRRLQQLAKEKGERFEPTNYALAYVLNQTFPTCAVIGPQSVAEVASSVNAAAISLTHEESRWLNLQ